MIYETNFTERDNEFIDALFEHIDNNPVKSKEETKVKEIERPYNAEALKKWSAFRIDPTLWGDKPYEKVRVPLTELVKHKDYAWLNDKLNNLYKNYSYPAYDLVWEELEEYNYFRRELFIQDAKQMRCEYSAKFQLEELVLHFGEIPKWIKELSPEKHALFLDIATLLYEVEPDYEICKLYLKDIYTVPERELMDDYQGLPIYHEIKPEELKAPHVYHTVVGKAVVVSDYARKLAEQAVIRDVHEYYRHHPEFKVAGSIEEVLCTEDEF